jgi:hypothetical protein
MHLAWIFGQTLQTRDPPTRSRPDENPRTDGQVRQLWNRLFVSTHTRRIRCGVITGWICERIGDIRHSAFVPSGLVGDGRWSSASELLRLSPAVWQEVHHSIQAAFVVMKLSRHDVRCGTSECSRAWKRLGMNSLYRSSGYHILMDAQSKS